ncbi:MAG: hypothetical protein H6660_14220 [Ardenticatenaceae bacterium]|nr:hypothetical protein [Ardenticatenaceae bacterium]
MYEEMGETAVMIDKPYTITRTCPACHGRKTTLYPHCAVCQQPVVEDDPWWKYPDYPLPCGHEALSLRMEQVCGGCEGNGRITQHLSPAEWLAYRRHRRRRRAFVAVLILILLATLGYFILREPHYLCGTVWYGLGTAVLLTIHRFPLTIGH